MSSPPSALQFLETDDPTETPLQNPVSAVDTSPQPDVNTEQNAQKQPSLPRPILIYTRDQLLFLSNSPLVKAPPDMPDLKHWYGADIENQVKKDDSSTPGNARERRFRRDAEDGETHPRSSFRSALTQPSQMGNFKHQSLRPNDRDRERDRERDGEKDRERDIRDKEGQERLRHLSDKYDRDRLAHPLPNARVKDRDAAANLNTNSSRGSQALNANAAARRAETRETGKKKVGEASEDWRRGAETRPGREDRSDNGSKRDSSASRRDREKDHDETRDKGRRGDRDDHRREKEEPRRDRDIDAEDDPRRWKDDGRREERLATRRAERERERARDKPGQDHTLDASDRRWTPADDRDGRYKRSSARERKSGQLGDEGKEKEDRKDREREKEKEPAWMDTYIPTDSSPGILGGQIPGGELDGIQAWKKGLKDKEVRDHGSSPPRGQDTLGQPSSSTLSEPTEKVMDEIQLFKLMMKREEEKKKSEDISLPVLLDDGEPSQQKLRKILEEPDSSSNTILSLSGFTNSGHPQNVPVPTSTVGPSPVRAGTPPEILSLAPKDTVSQSNSKSDHLQDHNPPFALKPLPNAVSTEASQANLGKQTGDFAAPQSFHPPPGSRLLAFARVQPKAVPNANQATSLQTLNGQNVQPESQGFSKNDSPRTAASFSPFEEQSRQTYDESRDSGIATNLMNLSLRGSVDQMFNSSNNQPEPVYNGLAAPKGSRFAKFFDGKARDTQSQSNKSQAPVGYVSPSPNHHQRQEQSNLNNLASNPGDQRTMDDIFAMLNSSSQRGNIAHHPVTGQLLSNNGFGAQGPNLHILQQHHLQQQQQQHSNGRLESLYESRADDRSFVPDGMVPGLRPIPPLPARSRDNLGYFPEQLEDGLHYNLQRITQQQQTRNLESLYSGSATPIYGQQGRHAGIPLQSLQQPQYRGGPSPNLTQQTTLSNGQQQQRLPPGLTNLGARPPHEPATFQGLSTLPSVNPHNNLHGNGALHQMQQPSFNNFNVPNNLAFNNPQVRGPMPVQNSVAQHTLGNIGHPNMDPRLSNHHHLMGLGGSGVGGTRMNGGFSQPVAPSHLLMRPQQQQQQPLPHQHMLPHLIPPHLPPQGHPGPSNQPNDLMALLMGGPHRE